MKPQPDNVLLRNVDYLDVEAGRIVPNCSLRLSETRIKRIEHGHLRPIEHERVYDLKDQIVIPGLIDCHVHCSPHLSGPPKELASTITLSSARRVHRMLRRGFTTVRDAGGTDAGLKRSIEMRVVPGPRMFVAGKALSQSGGHGDPRSEFDPGAFDSTSHSTMGFGRVADGVSELTRAVRDELRLGADQIKIMACGGVGSATGSLEQMQFSDEEVRAVVGEASRAGTYVMAHVYGARGIERLVSLGVRTIEHGNFLDEQAALAMAARGAILVPNYVAYQSLSAHAANQGYPESGIARLRQIRAAGLDALSIASSAGVKVAYGSDLVKDPEMQSDEFRIRSAVQAPLEVIRSATVTGADVLRRRGTLGVIAEGASADLLAVQGDPTADVKLLTEQGRHLSLIMKEGFVEKDALHEDRDAHWLDKWCLPEMP